MSDPLRHHNKLDIAEEILDFIASNPDAEEVRVILRSLLDIDDRDFDMAHEVVEGIRNLVDDQEF